MRADPELRARIAGHLRTFERRAIPAGERRPAAVAVTLLPDRSQRACFAITRRAASLGSHAGQWALPGGRLDAGETPEQAALRELHEEVGLELAPDAVLGRLDDFATRSGYVMTPVVVWAEAPAPLVPSPDEVAHAYRVPLASLERPEVPRLWNIPESERPVLSIPLESELGTTIHSPTAAILYQLREVALHGRDTRVAHYEQPRFAWR